jgi:hypothetical protein
MGDPWISHIMRIFEVDKGKDDRWELQVAMGVTSVSFEFPMIYN